MVKPQHSQRASQLAGPAWPLALAATRPPDHIVSESESLLISLLNRCSGPRREGAAANPKETIQRAGAALSFALATTGTLLAWYPTSLASCARRGATDRQASEWVNPNSAEVGRRAGRVNEQLEVRDYFCSIVSTCRSRSTQYYPLTPIPTMAPRMMLPGAKSNPDAQRAEGFRTILKAMTEVSRHPILSSLCGR